MSMNAPATTELSHLVTFSVSYTAPGKDAVAVAEMRVNVPDEIQAERVVLTVSALLTASASEATVRDEATGEVLYHRDNAELDEGAEPFVFGPLNSEVN